MLNDGKEHLAEIYDRHLEMIQTGSERILLIDDEKFQVDLGKRMLEGFGFAETARTDSIGALKLFRLSKGGHHDQTN
jgi:hypothetical protein